MHFKLQEDPFGCIIRKATSKSRNRSPILSAFSCTKRALFSPSTFSTMTRTMEFPSIGSLTKKPVGDEFRLRPFRMIPTISRQWRGFEANFCSDFSALFKRATAKLPSSMQISKLLLQNVNMGGGVGGRRGGGLGWG
jgi:hypothetical protein